METLPTDQAIAVLVTPLQYIQLHLTQLNITPRRRGGKEGGEEGRKERGEGEREGRREREREREEGERGIQLRQVD